MLKKIDSEKFGLMKDALLPGVFFALLVRWCVAQYPYSGYKKPPMYGDYEAQRHWQEITVQTSLAAWYRNSTQNDLNYWGLDYPPLTAYHSYMMGSVAEWLDPESVRLFASRGYENDSHKTFMRWTVFLSDVYFYVSAVLCICMDAERVKIKEKGQVRIMVHRNMFKRVDLATTLFLLYPGIILIDHGHFQYNCVSLGLFLWATFFVIAIENDILCTIFFVLALNYKQMELYHALPFFFYLLSKCLVSVPPDSKLKYFLIRFYRLAVAVVTTFIIVWLPLLSSPQYIQQILHRLFPLKRGIFEDKVSNIWCFVNVFVKLKSVYTNETMAIICLVLTGVAVLPSCLDLFFRLNKKKFVLSLINVSLAFFLFSFQVHEKSILLVSIPVLIYFPNDPFMCFWFLLISNFSMLPLLLKDGLAAPYLLTNALYITVYSLAIKLSQPKAGYFSFFNANLINRIVNPDCAENSTLLRLVSINFFFSMVGIVWMTLASMFVEPPALYPDLFPLLVSVFSFVHFAFFFLYFYYNQLSLPMSFENKLSSMPIIFEIKLKKK